VISTGSFPNSPGSVTRARRLATDALADVPKETRDAVEVLLSEIATNCVRHTTSEFSVRVVVAPEHIRVDVTDQGGGQPELRSPRPSEPSGRGLRIVDLLSDRWGVTFESDSLGKTVWFEVENPSNNRRMESGGAESDGSGDVDQRA
jgi:serine/threonine-protein kinase RsbW